MGARRPFSRTSGRGYFRTRSIPHKLLLNYFFSIHYEFILSIQFIIIVFAWTQGGRVCRRLHLTILHQLVGAKWVVRMGCHVHKKGNTYCYGVLVWGIGMGIGVVYWYVILAHANIVKQHDLFIAAQNHQTLHTARSIPRDWKIRINWFLKPTKIHFETHLFSDNKKHLLQGQQWPQTQIPPFETLVLQLNRIDFSFAETQAQYLWPVGVAGADTDAWETRDLCEATDLGASKRKKQQVAVFWFVALVFWYLGILLSI